MFESLASELTLPLTGYLRKMVGNAADADDLLQETLMRIARGLPHFESRSSPKTWAFRIATNVAIDFMRKTGRVELMEFDESCRLAEGDLATERDDEDRLVLAEMNACVREVIDSLPPEYGAVLVLFNLEGRSVAEVAEICGISVSLAKVRIHRGKGRLKKALDRECVFYETTEGNLRCDRKDP